MNIFSHFGRSSRKSSTSKKPAHLGEKLGKNRLAIEALEERQLLDAAGFETLPDVITIAEPNSYHFAYEGTPIDFVDSSSVDGLTASFVTGDQVAFTIMKTSTDGAVSSLGEVTIQLFNNEAPNSVSHFEQLVWEDYYEGLTFHRIYPGFMFQGGSSDGHGYTGSDLGPIADEYSDVLTHSGRGMVAYANAGPNTSDAQFYITFDSADWLDGHYNVFGFVVDGYDVIDQMEAAEVVPNEKGEVSSPVDLYTIEGVRFVENPTQGALRIVADGNASGVSTISFSSSQTDDALAFQETTVYVGEDGFEAYVQQALDDLNISVEAGSSVDFSLPTEFGGYSVSYSVAAEESGAFELIDLGEGLYRVVTDSSAVPGSEESIDFDFTVSASLSNGFNASNLSGGVTVTSPEQIDNPPVLVPDSPYETLPEVITIAVPNSYHFAYEGTPVDFVDTGSIDGLTASLVTGDQVAFTITKTSSTDGTVSLLGDVVIQLFNNEAPNSVSHFEDLVYNNYYEGKNFHRIYPGFVFQGGSIDGAGHGGSGLAIADEYSDVLTHSGRGMVAYANAGPNTSDAQFYITFDSADWLDGHYNVFGFVVDGYDVIDQMEAAEVVPNEKGEVSSPVDLYTIEGVRFVENPTQGALRIVADGNASGVSTISFSSSQTDDALAIQETTVYVGEDGFEAYVQQALDDLNISVEAGSSVDFSLPTEFGGYSVSYSVSAEESGAFELIDLGEGLYRVVTDSSAVPGSEESIDFDFTVSASLFSGFNASNLNGSITVTSPELPTQIVISGYVYADYDVDCNYDPEDSPLSGVEVALVSEDGRIWTTETDVCGYYEFRDERLLPGKYEVYSQENYVSPEGLTYADFCAKGGLFGEKISPVQIEVYGMRGGDVASNNNFAKVLPGSISGYVFEDRNDANNKETGEPGIPNSAQVELYRITEDGQKFLMETQTVDGNGFYQFDLDCSWNESGTYRKLPGRTYEVREVFSEDYTDGKDYLGSLGGILKNDIFSEVFVGYGSQGFDYNFGELKPGSIVGNVYEDNNDNGIFEENEAGIAAVTIELYQFDGSRYVKIGETTTDEVGTYRFNNLDIEEIYAVREIQPADWYDGKDHVGSLGGSLVDSDLIDSILIRYADHGLNYDFGELKQVTPNSEPINWSLADYPAQKSYKVDVNVGVATLYGIGKNGDATELATSAIGTDGTLTIIGQGRVAETICVTASATSSLSAINFDGGDGSRDAIYVETTDGDDIITIDTEVSETSTPVFARNPYEKALTRYAKLYGENSAQYARIKASYDAAFGRLSRFVRTTRSTSGLVSIEGGATLKFNGVKDVAIDSGDGNDVFKLNNLGFNYVLTGGNGSDALDFSGASNRVEVELGSACRQRPIKGDCGTLRLTDALEGFVGTTRGDRVVASALGATINGGGGADSVVLVGGSNLVALTGAGQSVSISGSGQYFVTVEDGDRSIVNARGAKSDSTIALDVEGDGVEVFGGRGAVEATIVGDRAKLNLSNASSASVFVSGDLARIETGSGNDFVSVTGAGASVALGAGNDVAFLSDGTSGRFGGSRIDGGAGNDYIFAANASGSNVLRTGAGNDVVIGSAGDDEIRADSGNNVLFGMSGADSIYGGRGLDLLVGSRTTNLAEVETELAEVETHYRAALDVLYSNYYMDFATSASRMELDARLAESEADYRESVDYFYADIYANWSDATDLDAVLDVLGTESISDGSKDVVKRGSNLDATILDPEDVERGANGYDWGFWRW